MKWIFSLLVVGISFVNFSQAQNPSEVSVIKDAENEGLYSFSHQVEFFPQLEERLLNYSNRDRELILELDTRYGVCKVLFIHDITDTELNETLMFLVNGLGFGSFIIHEN